MGSTKCCFISFTGECYTCLFHTYVGEVSMYIVPLLIGWEKQSAGGAMNYMLNFETSPSSHC